MTRHVNDRVAEYFFCGVVRRTESTDEGPRERETLLYNETIAARGQRFILTWQGMPLEHISAQKLLGSTDTF